MFSGRKALENRCDVEDDRCAELEAKLREAQSLLHETEAKSEEVCPICQLLTSVAAHSLS